MNLKRFSARTSREALALVREAFGDDAVVMSTKPCAEGVEVLAMAPESVQQIERVGAQAQPVRAAAAAPSRAAVPASPARAGEGRGEGGKRPPAPRIEPQLEPTVAQDVDQLQMSTLSFQDYVRTRMLKRREAELAAPAAPAVPVRAAPAVIAPIEAARARAAASAAAAAPAHPHPNPLPPRREREPNAAAPVLREPPGLRDQSAPREPPVLRNEIQLADVALAPAAERRAAAPSDAENAEMISELRSMRGLIEQRFGALAFMEKLQRQPRQAQLSQRLLDAGFSPALIRKLVESLPADVDEMHWASGVLERNLLTAEREAALEDSGGVFAFIGATGVGKTTSTAKLAAAFATRHGAAHLGLITLDAYRVAAHEQLRTYGRILGVPVHTAHDRASLEDLLELLSAKKMVLIDTAGMAQRDSRTRELLEMLSHRSIHKLLVVNASAQGETIEDQLNAYAAPACRGVVLSKVDEAVKLAPALDATIRHRLKVLAIANGQRVPEDWHRLSAHALVQRALKSVAGPAWKVDASDVNLIFAGLPAMKAGAGAALHA